MRIITLKQLKDINAQEAKDVFLQPGSWHTDTEGLYKLTFSIENDDYETDYHNIKRIIKAMKKADFYDANIIF